MIQLNVNKTVGKWFPVGKSWDGFDGKMNRLKEGKEARASGSKKTESNDFRQWGMKRIFKLGLINNGTFI